MTTPYLLLGSIKEIAEQLQNVENINKLPKKTVKELAAIEKQLFALLDAKKAD